MRAILANERGSYRADEPPNYAPKYRLSGGYKEWKKCKPDVFWLPFGLCGKPQEKCPTYAGLRVQTG